MEGISVTQLRTAFNGADEAKAATRPMVALADTDGVAVETIAERYSSPQSTIYDRLDRLEK